MVKEKSLKFQNNLKKSDLFGCFLLAFLSLMPGPLLIQFTLWPQKRFTGVMKGQHKLAMPRSEVSRLFPLQLTLQGNSIWDHSQCFIFSWQKYAHTASNYDISYLQEKPKLCVCVSLWITVTTRALNHSLHPCLITKVVAIEETRGNHREGDKEQLKQGVFHRKEQVKATCCLTSVSPIVKGNGALGNIHELNNGGKKTLPFKSNVQHVQFCFTSGYPVVNGTCKQKWNKQEVWWDRGSHMIKEDDD